MIEIGKRYKLITLQMCDGGYDQTTEWVTFTKVEGNLAEINGHTVVNLASPLFHSATDVDGEKAYLNKMHDEFEAHISGKN